MDSAATWLRCTRAGAVAVVATLLAVVAHVHADGHAPSLSVLSVLVLGLTAAAALVLGRPASTARVVLLTVGGQLVAHVVLGASGAHGGRAAGGGAMRGMSMPHADHLPDAAATGAASGPLQSLAGLLGLDARMAAAHLLAAVVVGLWLAAGERAVWSLVTHIWRLLRVPVLAVPTTPVPDRGPAPRRVVPTLVRLVNGTVVRRGPPLLLGT